jgi:hypothetical protein
VKGSEARGQSGKLCGVPRYVAQRPLRAAYEREL